ncbi:MAG: hypothetical protein GY767_08810 [Shimia sp.]|nr:hypothetical protein [Shimia sp.]
MPKVSAAALQGSRLDEDWAALLGTPFGSHSVRGKSQRHPDDVRRHYLELETRRSRVYPRRDLVSARTTLAQVLEKMAP